MCGIFGAIGKFNQTTFREAVKLISHRGPDDDGFYFDTSLAFGHRRLSILDTTNFAHQPMISRDNCYILIYNGEIYNHKEIRQQLKYKYNFRSTGDTETLLNAYIEYGEEVFSKLNGIFSLAIYDRKKKKIILARDHFGVKPLYYYFDKDKFLFGSEIKSINLFPIDRTLNYKALYDYLRFLYGPFTNTPFKYVNKLEPGHYITFKTTDFPNFTKKKFYEIPYAGIYMINDEKTGANSLDKILSESVSRQMLSDVPIGFFLSGGLDSSAIVAMARKSRPNERLECFSIDTSQYGDYDGFSNDLSYARQVAHIFDCKHNVIKANIDIINSFESMIWSLDEPQADPAPLLVDKISQAAQEMGIKVLIGGTGGDDVFSGYRRHQALHYEPFFEKIPESIKKLFARHGRNLNSNIPFLRRIGKVLANIDLDMPGRLFNYYTWIPKDIALSLFNDDIKEEIGNYDQQAAFMNILNNIPEEHSWLNKMLYWEKKSFLVDHNLNYTDKMSMARGIETRVPFLDIDLVKFATSLDPNLKMKGTITKYLLKRVMEQYLPQDVIYRPKTGFGAPVRRWIKEDMDEMIGDLLSENHIKNLGIFNVAEVSKLIKLNKQGKIDASYTIWSILAIVIWMKLFLNNKSNSF